MTLVPGLPVAITNSKSFAFLTLANLGAQCAEQLSLAAVPILAVVTLGAGPGEIGLLATVQTLPFLMLSVPFGLLADRISRRRLMLVAEALRALTLIALMMSSLLGWLSVPLLALLGFMGAVGSVGFMVTAPSLVPSLVTREVLPRANAKLELARSAAFAAGPAAGGALVSWAGAPSAFVLAAVLSLVAVALLLGLSEPVRERGPVRHPILDLREGAALVLQSDLLRPVLYTAIVWNISWFVLHAAYVPYALRRLGLSPAEVGITLAMCGAGMVCGAMLALRIMRMIPLGRSIQIGPAMSVLASLVMVITLWIPSGLLAGLSFFLFGAGPVVWTIASTTLRQAVSPERMLGRVSAIFLTVNAGARPAGAALGALVGGVWGEGACLTLALAGFVFQALLISKSQVMKLQVLPGRPA